MNRSVDFDASEDPLYRDVRLKHRVLLPVLGIPVAFSTNSSSALEVVESAFGAWRVLEGTGMVEGATVTVNMVVHDEVEGEEGLGGHPKLRYRAPDGERVLVMSGGSVGMADARRREVVAYVTPSLVADAEHFRYGFLEALTLATLSQYDRQPLHAAAIVRDSTALLLAGESGAGKSTLCYEAARAGFSVLSDDVVNIQLSPSLRVWGMPGHVHLPKNAPERFPELAHHEPTMLANGKEKIAINLIDLGAAAHFPVVEKAGLCFVRRSEDGPSLSPLGGDELEALLTARPEPGFDAYAESIREGVHLLAQHGGWLLRPGHAVGGALPLLDEVFAALGSRTESAGVASSG